MAEEKEIELTGGRVTMNVSRRGDVVLRPCCKNADLVHDVLRWLERKGVNCTPRFLGSAEDGREMLTFLPGDVPKNLGEFSEVQLHCAGQVIRTLHDALGDFPGCGENQTVCHNDLSPCNFAFHSENSLPYGVIDWDAAQIGHPLDDLAYALWMWCDIGNPDQGATTASQKMEAVMEGYGLCEKNRVELAVRILAQMRRVGESVFPKEEQTTATKNWTIRCSDWLRKHRDELPL